MLLHHHFIRIAKKHSKKTALIDRSANKIINYSTALVAALILSRKFDSYDKGFVGIMIPTSAGAALAILGVLMSGRTPVIINYSTGAKENAECAQRKCNFTTIITSRALLEKAKCPPIKGMVFMEEIMETVTRRDKIMAVVKSRLPAVLIRLLVGGREENENAVILFTSGSEKMPKAVPLTHRNILANITGFSEGYGFGHDDKILANLPYFHGFGLTANLWMPIYHGMTLVTYANPVDYRTISNIVREEKPSLMIGTPSFYWGYLMKSEPGDYSSIRIAAVGADKCPESLREQFLDKHGIMLYEGYGTTETAPVISANNPQANRPGSVGKPLINVQVRIQNSETRRNSNTNETGKIMVRGDSVMKGYFDDLEETSLRLNSGWYDTGDMGYLDEDGYLWHTGRLNRYVKIAGEMISLVRIEEVLSRLLPQDCQCCVVGVPDEIKGARILAAVTRKLDEAEILKSMSKQLPNIALPKGFIRFEELPQMGSGKVDFRTTAKMVLEILKNRDRKSART